MNETPRAVAVMQHDEHVETCNPPPPTTAPVRPEFGLTLNPTKLIFILALSCESIIWSTGVLPAEFYQAKLVYPNAVRLN